MQRKRAQVIYAQTGGNYFTMKVGQGKKTLFDIERARGNGRVCHS